MKNNYVILAFIAKNKHNLRFDGFYFIGFNNANHDSPLTQCAVFLLSYCSDIDLTRCFMDGRGPGYSPKFLNAFTCADLLVKNCVIMSGFSGMHTWLCPGLRIQHCLFLRNLITALGVTNAKNSPFCIRDNIFSDGLPVKVGVFLLNIGVELDELKSLDEGNNCFFVRLPDAERKPLRVARVRMSLADYVAAGARSDSILADPQFVALQDLDRPVKCFSGDLLVNLKLDFDRLFAVNPEVVRRGMGLQPEVYSWIAILRRNADGVATSLDVAHPSILL